MSTTDEDALRAMRAASPALQEWWPDGESPRSWKGVEWRDGRVQELDLSGSELEVLAPEIGQLRALTNLVLNRCPLKELPPEIGQLRSLTDLVLVRCPLKELPPEFGQLLALTALGLRECEQLALAPGAKKGQPAQTIVAAYARLLVVEPRKDAPDQLHAFLIANPQWVPAFFKFILTWTSAAHVDWLGEAFTATPPLAQFTDTDGRRATDIAEEARLSRANEKPDEITLRAMRAASPALQEWWPDGKSPRSWQGVTWSGDRVEELDLSESKLEVLAPQVGQLQALTWLTLSDCPLKELPPQIGQLRALTHLFLRDCPLMALPPELGQLLALTDLRLGGCPLKELPPEIGQLLALTYLYLRGCEQLTLAPGAEKGQRAQTTVAAYARLLIVEPRKDTPGQLHAFLLDNTQAVPAFFKFIVGDLTGDAHAVWLGEAVKATPELAHLTAPDGRSVTDVSEQARLSRATAKPDEVALH
eukprot:scaffold13951_cov54-Phaeocystis_antarctica.AAC.2